MKGLQLRDGGVCNHSQHLDFATIKLMVSLTFLGQHTIQVMVIRLLSTATIEEHIAAVAEDKRRFMDSSITGRLL